MRLQFNNDLFIIASGYPNRPSYMGVMAISRIRDECFTFHNESKDNKNRIGVLLTMDDLSDMEWDDINDGKVDKFSMPFNLVPIPYTGLKKPLGSNIFNMITKEFDFITNPQIKSQAA